MQVAQNAPEAANQLIDGYCDDFISLAAMLAQTLEQASMRGVDITANRENLRRISTGMSSLSEAIQAVIATDDEGGGVSGSNVSGSNAATAAPATTERPQRRRRRPGAPPAKQAALKGNNRSMPLRSVFQFIERMNKTGIVNVKLKDEALRFQFANGQLVACATNNQGKGDRLGDLLMDICDPGAIATVLRSSDTMDNSQVGEQVLRAGAATPEQVTQALTMQLKARFTRACDANEAVYAFLEKPAAESDDEAAIDQE